MTSAKITLQLLGIPVIRTAGLSLRAESTMLFSALLRICLEDECAVERTQLAHCLWPTAESDALRRQSLRQLMYRARQLGIELVSDGDVISVCPDDVQVDSRLLLAQGLLEASQHDVERLGEGVLVGFSADWSRPLSVWLEDIREKEHSLIRRGLNTALSALAGLPHWSRIESTAKALQRLDPFNTRAAVALAAAHQQRGEYGTANGILEGLEVGSDATARASLSESLRKEVKLWMQAPRAEARSDAATILHGRVREISAIAELLRSTASSRGRLCYIHGGSGVGKSRLLLEAMGVATRLGMRAISVRVEPSGYLRPLGTWSALAKDALKLPGALGASADSLGICRDVAQGERDVDAFAAAVAVAEVLTAVAHERPVVLAIDDAEQGSDSLWAAVLRVADFTRAARLAILVAGREELPLSSAPVGSFSIRLNALDDAATGALIDDLAVRRKLPLTEELRARCVAISGGLPLFAEEIVELIANEPTRDGRVRTLTETIRRRAQLLPEDAQQLLPLVAALDGLNSVPRLERLTGWAPLRILCGLDLLEREHFLHTADGAQRMRHSLITEASLSLLAPGSRLALHRAIADVLLKDARESGRPDVLVGCAHQLLLAGDADEAATVAADAAGHANRDGMSDVFSRLLAIGAATRGREAGRQVLRELVAVSATSANSTRGMQAISSLLSRNFDAGAVRDIMHELGASSIDVLRRQVSDWNPLVANSLGAISDLSMPAAERLEAAANAMVLASHVADVGLMRTIEDRVTRTDLLPAVNPEAFWRLQVVLNVHAGDLDVALTAASELIHATSGQRDTGRLSRALAYAGRVHRVLGDGAAAHEALSSAYSIAVKAGLASRAMGAVIEGLITAMQFVAPDDVRNWLNRASPVEEASGDPDYSATLRSLRVRAALLFGIGGPVRPEDGDTANPWTREQQVRPRATSLASAIHARVAFSAPVPESWLEQLSRDASAIAAQGDADWPVIALKMAHERDGNVRASHELIESYASVRRDRSALGPLLTLAPISEWRRQPQRRVRDEQGEGLTRAD